MTFDFSKLKFSTKGLIAFLLGLGSLLQVPQIGNAVMAFGKMHPHVAVLVATLTGVIGLLHNPTVERILGIQQTVASETLSIGDLSKTVMTSTTTTPVTSSVVVATPTQESTK